LKLCLYYDAFIKYFVHMRFNHCYHLSQSLLASSGDYSYKPSEQTDLWSKPVTFNKIFFTNTSM